MIPAYHYAQAPLLTGFQGDRLYIGTATGNIHIYNLNEGTDAGVSVFSRHCILTDVPLCGPISRRSKPNSHADRDQDWDIQEGHRSVRVHQGFKLARCSVWFESLTPQLCPFIDPHFLPETLPTLYPLPSFSPPTKLTQAKSALSFAVHSCLHNTFGVQSPDPAGSPGGFSGEAVKGQIPIPTTVTTLVVGCRRKVVVYTWKDGEAQEVKVSFLYAFLLLSLGSLIALP